MQSTLPFVVTLFCVFLPAFAGSHTMPTAAPEPQKEVAKVPAEGCPLRAPAAAHAGEQLYAEAMVEFGRGEPRQGVRKIWTLIKKYPYSPYATAAWIDLGEYFYGQSKPSQAVKSFRTARESQHSLLRAIATIRLLDLADFDDLSEQTPNRADAVTLCLQAMKQKSCASHKELLAIAKQVCVAPAHGGSGK